MRTSFRVFTAFLVVSFASPTPNTLAQTTSKPWEEGKGYCSNPSINQVCTQLRDESGAQSFCTSHCENKAKTASPSSSSNPTPDLDPVACQAGCKSALVAERNQIGERCLAIEYNDYGENFQGVAFGLHTVAAVACTAACAGQWVSLLAAPALEIACESASVAAGVWDMGSSIYLRKKYEQDIEWLGIAMGGIPVAMGLAGLMDGTRGGKAGADWLDKVKACVPAVMSAYLSYSKFQDWDENGARVRQECKSAEQTLSGILGSAVSPLPAPQASSDPQANVQLSAAGGIGQVAQDKQQDGKGNEREKEIKDAFRSPVALSKKLEAIAAKDPTGKTKAPRREDVARLFDALQGLGLDPVALVGQGFREGAGAAIASGISQAGGKPEHTEAAKTMVKNIEKNHSVLTARYGAPASALVRSDGKTSGKKDPFADLFGSRAGGGGLGGSGGNLQFDPLARPLPPALTDEESIFHHGFPGTLFDIVTGKLNQTQDRIESMEWDTRMNRALTGLPPKDPAAPARKAGEK